MLVIEISVYVPLRGMWHSVLLGLQAAWLAVVTAGGCETGMPGDVRH
jgi:hypothetical protein